MPESVRRGSNQPCFDGRRIVIEMILMVLALVACGWIDTGGACKADVKADVGVVMPDIDIVMNNTQAIAGEVNQTMVEDGGFCGECLKFGWDKKLCGIDMQVGRVQSCCVNCSMGAVLREHVIQFGGGISRVYSLVLLKDWRGQVFRLEVSLVMLTLGGVVVFLVVGCLILKRKRPSIVMVESPCNGEDNVGWDVCNHPIQRRRRGRGCVDCGGLETGSMGGGERGLGRWRVPLADTEGVLRGLGRSEGTGVVPRGVMDGFKSKEKKKMKKAKAGWWGGVNRPVEGPRGVEGGGVVCERAGGGSFGEGGDVEGAEWCLQEIPIALLGERAREERRRVREGFYGTLV